MPPTAVPTAPPRLKPHDLTDLATYGDMLHLIHHRNLNQHRHSIWWRSFSVFRRELSHFLSEYTTYQPPATATAAAPVSKPSAKASKAAARRAAARLEAWKRDAVPRWYLAFTEVIASTQFSAIGLVLLAILARVTHVTCITAAYEEEAERAMQAILREFAEKDARELFGGVEAGQAGTGKGAKGVEDLGEVVGRREDFGEVLARNDDAGEAVGSGAEEKRGARDKKAGKKKEQRRRDESKASTPATDAGPVARVDTKEVAVRKKKKKEKRAAEPSPELEPEIGEPPKKKKKTKKGKASAIDDLFAGL